MKPVLEDFVKLDIRAWIKSGYLNQKIFSCEWSLGSRTLAKVVVVVADQKLTLHFISDGYLTQQIRILSTPCHLGGKRQWLACPICGKRMAVLYGKQGGFACRKCLSLNYQCQHIEPHERLAQRAHKIRDRLKWPRGFVYGSDKPKGMHWQTFERLVQQAELAEEKWRAAAKAKFPDYQGFG